MDRGTVDIIGEWDSRPFTGGYAELAALADEEFSGAITTGPAWAFMLNGRVVGTVDGDIEAFESSKGTVYDAPHPGLVLLFAMQNSEGETQAKYYTDDTPLTEVNQTLSDSGFTGYVELSENVLSGDYYIVYYGGRSMNVAFVGNARRVLTDDEAFEQTIDEIGIYEVRSVELSVEEIPAIPSQNDPAPHQTQNKDAGESQITGSPDGTGEFEDNTSDVPVDGEEDTGDSKPPETEPQDDRTEQEPPTANAEPDDSPSWEAGQSPTAGQEQRATTHNRKSKRQQPESTDTPDPDRFSEEEAWRKTRTIPALDPEETNQAQPQNPQPVPQPQKRTQNQQTQVEEAEPTKNSPQTEPTPQPKESEITDLKSQIESQKTQISELRDQIKTVADERNSLATEREELEAKLSGQNQTSERTTSESRGAERTEIDETEALSQTDLFIRYGSKGAATLQDAHDNAADRDAVRSNLRLETHTRFNDDNLVVNGRPFTEFLQKRIEYQFVDWITDELLYEIRDTENHGFLKDLYDILPKIDRAELHGTVTSRDEEGDEIKRSFDVVLRDRMGQPLLVANVNESRDPAGGDMMSTLAEHATEMAGSHEQLGAAFLVTSSFFSPDALETASDATSGGFLSREKRKSYVKLSRKRGFHLCLIEARDDTFHIAVPEL